VGVIKAINRHDQYFLSDGFYVQADGKRV